MEVGLYSIVFFMYFPFVNDLILYIKYAKLIILKVNLKTLELSGDICKRYFSINNSLI